MTARWLSGFCNPSNPEDSHRRCAEHPREDGKPCACMCHTPPPTDALTMVTEAVDALVANLDHLLEHCTSPDGSDLAEFLLTVREAKDRLYREVEPVLEDATRKAMAGDRLEAGDLLVERYRSADRKTWDHDAWQRDVRAKVLRTHGLMGLQGVLTADGEVAPPDALYSVLRELQAVNGSHAPKTGKTGGGLRQWGLDPDEYCQTGPGVWHVRVSRVLAEGGENDAA